MFCYIFWVIRRWLFGEVKKTLEIYKDTVVRRIGRFNWILFLIHVNSQFWTNPQIQVLVVIMWINMYMIQNWSSLLKIRKLRLSLKSLYSVIWGQCSNIMVIKLMDIDDQKKWKKNGNCGKLLQAIKQIFMRFEHMKHPVVSLLLQQLRNFYSYRQQDNYGIRQYYEKFQLMVVKNIESFGGKIGVQPMFLANFYKLNNLSTDDVDMMSPTMQEQAYIEKTKERSYWMLPKMYMVNSLQISKINFYWVMISSQRQWPRPMICCQITKLPKISSMGTLENPTTVNVGVLLSSKDTKMKIQTHQLQVKMEFFRNVPCYRCQMQGHYANQCPLSFFQHKHHYSRCWKDCICFLSMQLLYDTEWLLLWPKVQLGIVGQSE